jgi:hypothetical protein
MPIPLGGGSHGLPGPDPSWDNIIRIVEEGPRFVADFDTGARGCPGRADGRVHHDFPEGEGLLACSLCGLERQTKTSDVVPDVRVVSLPANDCD